MDTDTTNINKKRDNNDIIDNIIVNDIDSQHISKKNKLETTTTTTTATSTTSDNKETTTDTNKKPLKYQYQDKAIYGNYHGYYNYRNNNSISAAGGNNNSKEQQQEDNRMKYLTKELFFQKRCLDIGCNSGDLVFKISKDYNPTQIIGIDIDKHLINRAYHQLTLEQSQIKNNSNNTNTNNNDKSYAITTTILDSNIFKKIERKDFIPISFRMISDGVISNHFPHNISFYCQNFLYNSNIVDKPISYDVITALSISKWIHLNWGDEGIKKFLTKIYSLLKPGGIFLFEPQPWKGYSKRKNLSELINKNFKEITFRPNQFNTFLIDQVGYKSFEFLNESEAKSKGFDRPLYKFIK